jgi:hypothetical protein
MSRRSFVKAAASAAAAAASADLLAVPFAASAESVSTPTLPVPGRGFISVRPAAIWEEALITGNGKMGALVMSQALDETIILSHERLFLPIHEPLPPPDTGAHLPEIRRLLKNGEYQKASDFVVDLSHKEGYGGKRWTDPFIPACDLRIGMAASGEVRDYVRSLDFETGVATVRWTDDRGTFTRRTFVSRPANAVVTLLEGPRGRVDAELYFEQHAGAHGIKQVHAMAEQGWLFYRSTFALTGGEYGCGAQVIAASGDSTVEGNRLAVKGADSVLVILRVEPDSAGSALKGVARLDASFDRLLSDHRKVHGRLFDRVHLDLGGGIDRGLAAEELVRRSREDALSPAMLEKALDAGRYAILSSCGDWPPNLQGVWSGTWTPPWSGDYTQNGNVQAAIASLLSGNLPECLKSYFGYLESHLDQCRENAKRLYNARGLYVPSRTSSHFLQNHFDATWPMTFWTVGAAWAARFYFDYYLYTGDRDFLRKRAFPYMKEAAAFFEDFLVSGNDGKWLFSPSYSPENNPGNSPSQACVNATMDIAALKGLLTDLIAAGKVLGADPDLIDRWNGMLHKIPAYQINKDGAVKEWTWPGLDDNYAHRHCSHLYPLFWGLPSEIGDNPPLRKAFQRALDLRIAERRREPGGGVMAFGLVQLGLAAGSLGDSESVGFVVDRLARNYYFPNLATSHDPGSIFNTDLSGGLPAVLIHSLVQSWPGEVTLLPALPRQMPAGRLTGVLCRGQVTLRELMWNSESVTANLESAIDQTIDIRTPSVRGTRSMTLRAGKPDSITIALTSGP